MSKSVRLSMIWRKLLIQFVLSIVYGFRCLQTHLTRNLSFFKKYNIFTSGIVLVNIDLNYRSRNQNYFIFTEMRVNFTIYINTIFSVRRDVQKPRNYYNFLQVCTCIIQRLLIEETDTIVLDWMTDVAERCPGNMAIKIWNKFSYRDDKVDNTWHSRVICSFFSSSAQFFPLNLVHEWRTLSPWSHFS